MLRAPVLAALLCAPLAAAPPPAAPAGPDIVFPAAPAPPKPPAPAPGPVGKLAADQLYVITSKTECVVRAHPAGLVKVEKQAGPVTIRGKFAGGPDKVETRKFAGPFVYVLEAVGTGRVEIDVVPLGLKAEADIRTATVDVDAGQGPTPPPKPKPDPDPPKPRPDTSFRVVFVYESGAPLAAAQSAVIYGKAVEEYLNAACTKEQNLPGWRRYDKDADAAAEQPTMRALWAAVKPALTTVPCVVIEVNGKADILALPANQAEAVAILKKYAEGK